MKSKFLLIKLKAFDLYRLPTKLLEDHVFSCVRQSCPSVWEEGGVPTCLSLQQRIQDFPDGSTNLKGGGANQLFC